NLENDSLQYDDDSKQIQASNIDFNHIHADQLNIQAKNLLVSSDSYSGVIDQIAFNERSGFILKRLSTHFSYNDKQASLKNLVIQTNQSNIRSQSSISYASTSALSSRPGEIKTDIQFDRSLISVSDLLKWVPSLKGQFKDNENSLITIQGKVNGLVKDLNISNLELSGLHHINIKVAGKLKGLPDAKRLSYDLNIAQLNGSKADVEALVPAKYIPSSVRIPNEFSISGKASGDLNRFNTDLNLVTSDGSLHIQGPLNLKDKNYDLHLHTESLNLGYILKQDSLLGVISLEANARGDGFDYKTMNTVFHLHLLNGEFNGYEYENLNLSGKFEHGIGNLESSIDDENISFDLKANANLSAKYPGVQVTLKLDTLNAYALHLMHDTVSFKLNLEADFPSTNPDSLDGNAKIYDIVLANKTAHYMPDSVFFQAEAKDTAEHISLHSELAEFDWAGKYKLTEVGQALEQTINHYYNFKNFKEEKISSEDWKMKLKFHASPLVLQYMTELRGTDTVEADMNFRSDTRFLRFTLSAPKMQYGKNIIHNLQIGAITRDSSFNYRIQLADAGQPGFRIYRSSLRGHLSNNKFFATINLKDEKDKDRYLLSTLVSPDGNGFRLLFNADSLVLNYDKWNIAKDNFIQYDSGGLIVHDLKLQNASQSLSINSEPATPHAPIKIVFDQFRIKTLTSFVEQDSLLIDGLLNGN
ncbi:MAG TPA: hypothetical protein VFV08_01740, partial [Puia sp.]|nr:hypothetical protein [Puia sp.]